MNLYPIEAGNFKLDGGAMFGVVPKSIWQKTNPPDSNNMIGISTRCLLVEDQNRLTLIDTGLGNKQSEKFFKYYFLWGDHDLDTSLAKYGFHRDDITDVLMTHLHFDHCGGSVIWNKNRTDYIPAFKNARYWSNENHWNWAIKPNIREGASFKKENIIPIEKSGQLNFIPIKSNSPISPIELGFDILLVDGHTEKQMIPIIPYKNHNLVYVADLVPTVGHVPVAYIPGYDTRPLISLEEKKKFLTMAYERSYLLFFEHDCQNELCSLKKTERGIRVDQILKFSDLS